MNARAAVCMTSVFNAAKCPSQEFLGACSLTRVFVLKQTPTASSLDKRTEYTDQLRYLMRFATRRRLLRVRAISLRASYSET